MNLHTRCTLTYPVLLCVCVWLGKLGVSAAPPLPLGMAFLRRRSQVAMSTFI